MNLLEIKKYGCPVLRKKAALVTSFDAQVKALVEDMFETMYEAKGVGLAAPQVGVLQRITVLDVGIHDPEFQPVSLINPEILEVDGMLDGDEGCLSFPGLTAEVKRPTKTRVRGFDAEGRPIELEVSDISARVVVHEIEHLDGILFIDHVNALKRQLMRSPLRKLQKEGLKQTMDKKIVKPQATSDLRS